MHAKSRIRYLMAACALSALPVAVMAQTSGTTTTGTTTTTTSTTTSTPVSADRLIQRYTKLAGSKENATKLVTGLRDGSKEISLSGSGSSGGTTITNPLAGRTMGYGNVNIVLAMAERQMAGDTSPTLQNVLTNPDNGILTLRASGMGWGQIAQNLGFKLGEVMGNAPSKESTAAKRQEGQQSQRASRDARERGADRGGDRGQMARAERPERIERPQKVERVERVERPQRPERGGK